MKLLRYGLLGQERPGLLDSDSRIRDLSRDVADIGPDCLTSAGLAGLAKLDPRSLPLVDGSPRLGVPVARVGKFIAIGLNFVDHAAESNLPIPKEPVVFTKATSSLAGPNDQVMLPKDSTKSDWEVELGVVIGRRASYVEQTEALDHVTGYCVVNDVSEREYQIERGGTWDKGKGCDTFGPVGPWVVTKDEVPDPQTLGMWLDVNGQRMQTGNTKTMIFDCRYIVWCCSQYFVMEAGDVILTGTPPGVGLGMKPKPKFLKAGDVVTLGIDGLGEQRQKVVKFKA